MHAELEGRILAELDAGRVEDAATLLIRGLGPELLGYLCAILRSADAADEVFGSVCADLWQGLTSFRRESAVKTWAYCLARHAALRYLRDPYRRRGGALHTDAASRLAAEVRTATAPYLQTRAKEALAEMREALTPDEQTLLVLRIDRGMSWAEIAVVLEETKEDALRKRFERLKEKLRAEAMRRGLIDDS